MDSDHPTEKSRRRNHRQLPDLKFDNFGVNPGSQEDLWNSSSRVGSKKSSPELENNPKHWTNVSQGFPPGVTVDELKKYGRRRQQTHLRLQDNLRVEEGSLKAYKSEYKRRFQGYGNINIPESFPGSKDFTSKKASCSVPEYQEFYVNFTRERPILKRPPNNLLPLKDHPMEITTEKNSQYVPIFNYEKRKLLRKSTALKQEGEMTSETEARREYRGYQNPEKAQLVRRLPALRLEGELGSMMTEQREKFITFLLDRRPVLEKKKSSLKMEGNFDFLTENGQSYVQHELSARPRIRKRSTSLKLDGEVEFFPEYRKSFVDFPRTRPITYKPNENIRQEEGEFNSQTETKTKFVNFENVSVPESARPENNLHVEGEMEISPEYRYSFVDFPRERPFVRRPLNQLKPEGNLQVMTESLERFSDVGGGEKPESLKRPGNLRLEGEIDFLSENSEKFRKPDVFCKPEVPRLSSNLKLEGKMDFVTEKADKFGFLVPEREAVGRRPSSLKLEGEFLFPSEYRKSYVDFGKYQNVLKPIPKSNPPSPRKKPKENVSPRLDGDKKFILGTPRKKFNSKRLKEGTLEKNLKFENLSDDSKELEDQKGRFKPVIEFPGGLVGEKPLLRAKEFPAFQVLDVKGQAGCQKMKREVLGSDKSTSDEENPIYRLEVSNSVERSPGFYKSDKRVFPNQALDSKALEEAERRAKQRQEGFLKIVKSPEVPNYLLEESESEKENKWKVPEKLCPLTSPEDMKPRAFMVLDNEQDFC